MPAAVWLVHAQDVVVPGSGHCFLWETILWRWNLCVLSRWWLCCALSSSGVGSLTSDGVGSITGSGIDDLTSSLVECLTSTWVKGMACSLVECLSPSLIRRLTSSLTLGRFSRSVSSRRFCVTEQKHIIRCLKLVWHERWGVLSTINCVLSGQVGRSSGRSISLGMIHDVI